MKFNRLNNPTSFIYHKIFDDPTAVQNPQIPPTFNPQPPNSYNPT